MRKVLKTGISSRDDFKKRILGWLQQFPHSCFLDNNGWSGGWSMKCIAAAGCIEEIVPGGDPLKNLEKTGDVKDWLFGSITYDLKNPIEHLESHHPGGVQFPLFHFFRPEYVFIIGEHEVEIQYPHEYEEAKVNDIIRKIKEVTIAELCPPSSVHINPRITKDEYIASVQALKRHIRIGDIYEVNYCQEFYAEEAVIDPVHVYTQLDRISKAPFSAFYRQDDKYLLCASPERFLSKHGDRIISQPIKGTARRGKDASEDEQLKAALASSEKERSENVMIVDLVRNDLSRIAKRGSVKVDELFGIYTFEQVHQMISTVSAEVKEDVSFAGIIRAAFPMGSMTGAPKVRAMQLIEEYEVTMRGLYSGTIGYIDPGGNFDFNVVIRSILYNASDKYLSFMVGSAITDGSQALSEYEECLVKAAAMLRVLQDKVHAG